MCVRAELGVPLLVDDELDPVRPRRRRLAQHAGRPGRCRTGSAAFLECWRPPMPRWRAWASAWRCGRC